MLMVLGGDVETNPGSPRSQKQRTLSFVETAARATETIATPASARDAHLNTSRSNQDSEVMCFLREMKAEVRADLSAKKLESC